MPDIFISFIDILCPHFPHSIHRHSFRSLLFSLFSILFANNILLSINLASVPYLCLLRYFSFTKLFPPPSHAIYLTISSFHNFLIYISFLDLSSLCFAGSLLVALTARNQYIPLHISYTPTSNPSIPTTTLDSDPPISQRCYPYHIHFLPLPHSISFRS